jgi:hypothetical protein
MSKSEMKRLNALKCIHSFLLIPDGDKKTTCRKCGRDFYLYADVDPAIEIAALKEKLTIAVNAIQRIDKLNTTAKRNGEFTPEWFRYIANQAGQIVREALEKLKC